MFWQKKADGPPPKDPPPGDEDNVEFEQIDCDDPNLWPTKHPLTGKLYLIPIAQVNVHVIGNPKRGFPLAITASSGGEMKKQAMTLVTGVILATAMAVGAAVFTAAQNGEDVRQAAEEAAITEGSEKGKDAAEQMIEGDSSSTASPSSSPAASVASSGGSSASGSIASTSGSTPGGPGVGSLNSDGSLNLASFGGGAMSTPTPIAMSASELREQQYERDRAEMNAGLAEMREREKKDEAKRDKAAANQDNLAQQIRSSKLYQSRQDITDRLARDLQAKPVSTPISTYADQAESAANRSAASAQQSAASAGQSAGSAGGAAGSAAQAQLSSAQAQLSAIQAMDIASGFAIPASPITP